MAIVYHDVSTKEEREIEWVFLDSPLGGSKFVISTKRKPDPHDPGDHTEIVLSMGEAKMLRDYLDLVFKD